MRAGRWANEAAESNVVDDKWEGDRDALLVDLIRNLVAASATPITPTAVLESAGGMLDERWAWWSREAVGSVVKEIVASDDVLEVDLLGRLYAPESVGKSHREIAHYGLRAGQVASALSEFEFDSSGDVARIYEKQLFGEELLDRDEERLLAFRVRAGDAEAREQMMLANTRLVASVANRVVIDGITLDHDDLFQTGCLGLLHAIDKFDPARGFKLSTYATWWIKQAIYRSIADTGRTIRVPVHIHERVRRLQRAEDKLLREFTHEPPTLNLAKEAGITVQQIAEIRAIPEVVPLEELDLDTLADTTQATNEEAVIARITDGDVARAIDALPYREAIVVRRRLGIGSDPWTLEAIGQEIGVTRERVRQLEKAALEQLQRLLRLWSAR